MRLSVFNHYVPGFPDPEDTLIYNTFSGAYVALPTSTVDALQRMDGGETLTPRERELVGDPDLYDPDVGVVVDSLEAEEAEFQQWFARRRNLHRRLDVVVGVNLACNFACTYCLQDGVLDGTVIKPDTADATADWLVAHTIDNDLQAVNLMFVGGEPLLHPQRIKRIAERVKAGIGDRELTFSLTTNGYFLTRDVVTELIPYGLRKAQVTLDGDATTHAKTRVCKSGEDTFGRILDNVIAASRLIRISINGNYQGDTIHGFGPLIRQLAQVMPRGTEVSFSPALQTMSSPEGSGSGSCSWSGSDTRYHVALHDEAVRNGLYTSPLNVIGPCEFHDTHAFAIDPGGTIYKCPGFLGIEDWGIGHVQTGLTGRYQEMLQLTPKSEPCGGCSHRPHCGGGCVAAEWIRTGDTSRVNCEHGYFEDVKRDAVIRNYAIAIEDDAEVAARTFPAAPHALPREQSQSTPRQVRSMGLRVLSG